METVEHIEAGDKPIAIIVRREFQKQGVHFFSPYEFSQQLGIIIHPSDHEVPPHIHKVVARDVRVTQEVLHIIEGRVEISLYDETKKYLTSRILNQGDTILLAYGGHGLRVLEPSKIMEVKQGPYAGVEDKEFFAES